MRKRRSLLELLPEVILKDIIEYLSSKEHWQLFQVNRYFKALILKWKLLKFHVTVTQSIINWINKKQSMIKNLTWHITSIDFSFIGFFADFHRWSMLLMNLTHLKIHNIKVFPHLNYGVRKLEYLEISNPETLERIIWDRLPKLKSIRFRDDRLNDKFEYWNPEVTLDLSEIRSPNYKRISKLYIKKLHLSAFGAFYSKDNYILEYGNIVFPYLTHLFVSKRYLELICVYNNEVTFNVDGLDHWELKGRSLKRESHFKMKEIFPSIQELWFEGRRINLKLNVLRELYLF